MRTLTIILFLFLASCSPEKAPKPDANLPSSSQMVTEGEVNRPVQVVEFCEENPEFEPCD